MEPDESNKPSLTRIRDLVHIKDKGVANRRAPKVVFVEGRHPNFIGYGFR